LQDERATRLQDRHLQSRRRGEPHLVADLDLLPLGDDTIGAVDITADEVLQEVVAVEASPPLTKLSDPRPDDVRAAANGDRPRRGDVRVADQVVARLRGGNLFIGRTPPKKARATSSALSCRSSSLLSVLRAHRRAIGVGDTSAFGELRVYAVFLSTTARGFNPRDPAAPRPPSSRGGCNSRGTL
jgi:hypothetical protein